MPYKIVKIKRGYEVVSPHHMWKHSTRKKAIAQVRLLQGIEHGWKPSKRRK
jgi:hypothetical protein